MESAFGWLGEIFNTILSMVPQLIVVRATHEGIKFQAGRRIKILLSDNGIPFPCIKLFFRCIPMLWFWRTGVHIYWPLVTEYEIVPVKRQTTNLAEQYLTTKDGKSVGLSGILVYEVKDVIKLLTECYDYEDTIQDISLSLIKTVITSHKLETLYANSEKIDAELTKKIRFELNRFGIRTIKFKLSDLTQCNMLGLWGNLVTVSYNQE